MAGIDEEGVKFADLFHGFHEDLYPDHDIEVEPTWWRCNTCSTRVRPIITMTIPAGRVRELLDRSKKESLDN